MGERADALFAELGYDGCRALREALQRRMAQHRKAVAEERLAAGLSRPRSTRAMTTVERSARQLGGVSEASLQRLKFVRQWRPDLAQAIEAGTISVWAAYKQAQSARDQAAAAFAAEELSAERNRAAD